MRGTPYAHRLTFAELLALRAEIARGRKLRAVADLFAVSLALVVWAGRGVETPEDRAAAEGAP